MSFNGKENKAALRRKSEIRAQLEIMRRSIDNAQRTAWQQQNGGMLDHMDHITTEFGRLKICLNIKQS